MRRIMSQLWSAQAVNLSRKNKVPLHSHTINTEKTKLVRYLLHLWVQIEGKDCNWNKISNLVVCAYKLRDLMIYMIIIYLLSNPCLTSADFCLSLCFICWFFFLFLFYKTKTLLCSHSFHWTFLLVFFLSIRPLILCL